MYRVWIQAKFVKPISSWNNLIRNEEVSLVELEFIEWLWYFFYIFSDKMDKLKKALTGRDEAEDEEKGFVAQVGRRRDKGLDS